MINWQTFVVRIWQEAGSGTWRGQIVHLPDQVSVHFATLAQAAGFMQHYLPGISMAVDGGRASEEPLHATNLNGIPSKEARAD